MCGEYCRAVHRSKESDLVFKPARSFTEQAYHKSALTALFPSERCRQIPRSSLIPTALPPPWWSLPTPRAMETHECQETRDAGVRRTSSESSSRARVALGRSVVRSAEGVWGQRCPYHALNAQTTRILDVLWVECYCEVQPQHRRAGYCTIVLKFDFESRSRTRRVYI